jgi:DNA-binding MarR family transcriptional regulator
VAARRGSVASEIKQRRPFRSAGHEAVVALFRTADVLKRSQSSLLEGRGLTLQQYNVLRILRGAGEEGLPTLEIAGRMIEQTPGITRLLDRIEKKGLARRWRCPPDRRQVFCRITPAGLELLGRLDPEMDRATEEAWRRIPAARIRRTTAVLDRLRANLS